MIKHSLKAKVQYFNNTPNASISIKKTHVFQLKLKIMGTESPLHYASFISQYYISHA